MPNPVPEQCPVGIAKLPNKPPRARPLAVIVKTGEEQFPELLRAVRNKVDPAVTGTAIARMRKTLNGNLLIEINGGAESATTVKQEVERSLGPEASVRMTDNMTSIEVRDLDEVTTKEEVLEAALALDGSHGERVVSIRRAYGGAQTAVVLLPKLAATKICEAGRIRVGLVYARVRATELSERCFRCLAFGHVARNCTGTDRRTCCWRCGAEGHMASHCTAAVEVVTHFKKVLSDEDGRVPQAVPSTQLVQPTAERPIGNNLTEVKETRRASSSS